jgi:putative ABC transport system permease protein
LSETLKEGGRSGHETGRRTWRNALIAAEVALSLMLLMGAGLMLRSFWQLLQVQPGFNAQNLLAVELSLPQERYATDAQRAQFYQQLLERLEAMPGVQAAAVVNHPPFSGRRGINGFNLEGQPAGRGVETPLADFRVISPTYFQLMGIPVLQGRALSTTDQADKQRVVVINQAFADRYWPGENPLGRRLRTDEDWLTVVGIVGNIRQSGLDQEAAPHVYAPYWQTPVARTGVLVRTTVEPLSLVAALRQQVLALDASQPIYNIHTLEELIAGSLAARRLNLLLLGVFALIALVLAAVGIYGVISYAVAQRQHEIGIRLALGAQRRDVLTLIIKQGMTPVVVGMGIGMAGTLLLTRGLATLVAGIGATDPLTLTGIAVLLGLVALLACYFPARRASNVDPLVALRYE